LDEGTPISEGARYAAFLSYSHKDSAAARWLHRRLETYRIPRRLVGTPGEHGPVPARLTPIFRDREELPAAGDLSERVRAALAGSRHLIVICSPNSAASLWVAKEIETFRQLHPGRPVYAAIVDGDPDQCFPRGLASESVEPLAADLRKGHDGRRLGFLKLVAGLGGVGLDALVQRDAARRLRRVTAVTAAALLAVLAMAVMTVAALNARTEANRQRVKAEGLIEFMMTDLRTKLKGVGRIDALRIANQRALDYYRRQPVAGLAPGSLELRARILHAIGEDYIAGGDLPAASAAFGEAYSATAAALEREPDEARAIFAHAQSEYWIGRVHEVRHEWPQALARYRRYADAARRLNEVEPGNPDNMMEMGYSATNLGLIELNGRGQPQVSQAYFNRAIAWFARAAKARPRDPAPLRELANAYNCLADSYYRQQKWSAVAASYDAEYRVTQRVVALDPKNTDSLYRLALAERALARAAQKVGSPARAGPLLHSALDRMEALAALDPANAEWLLMKTKIECDLLKASPGAARPELIRAISSAHRALLRQNNPRAADVSHCLGI